MSGVGGYKDPVKAAKDQMLRLIDLLVSTIDLIDKELTDKDLQNAKRDLIERRKKYA